MKYNFLRFLTVGTILGGVVLIGISFRKNITLIVDGNISTVTTTALTIGSILRQEGIPINSTDMVIPGVEEWLKDGQVVRVGHASQVHIDVDDEGYDFVAHERLPTNMMAIAGIPLYPGDVILLDGDIISPENVLPYSSSYYLHVQRAHRIFLQDGGEMRTFTSTASTLGEAIWEEGINLISSDKLAPPAGTHLSESLSVNLLRAKPVEITMDREVLKFYTTSGTVGEVLIDAGLPLQGLNYSIPREDQLVPEDGRIKIIRVAEEVVVEQKPLPFSIEFQPLPDVDIDTFQIIQPGEYGLQASRTRVRFEDGIEVARNTEAEWIAREPVNRIEGYGTKITIRTMSTPDGPIEYWRAVSVYATSYTAAGNGPKPGEPGYGITYSGEVLRKGHIAVLRSWYGALRGYRYYVPGYGFSEVADIGGGIPGQHWIDLGFGDQDEYVHWSSWTTLYFLTPIPPADQILWILP
jgi:uncharacterized protein YabE (DUF348 family)